MCPAPSPPDRAAQPWLVRRRQPLTRTARHALSAAAALLLITGCSTAPRQDRYSGAAAATAIVPLPQVSNEDLGAATSAPPAAPALQTAETYIGQWAQPTLDHAAWYAGVRPWVTEAYGQLLADTDPTHVPAHRRTGPPRPVSSTTAVLIVDVPTDAGAIRVTVVNTGGRWLVASAGPAPAP